MPKSESFKKISYWVEYKFTNEQLNFEKGIEDFLSLENAIKFIKELQKTYEIYGSIGYDIYKKECITSSEIELEIENDSIIQRKQIIECLMNSLVIQFKNLSQFKDEYGITKPEVNFIQSRYQYLAKLRGPLYKCKCEQYDCLICNSKPTNNSKNDDDLPF